jgi:hypothetical protein
MTCKYELRNFIDHYGWAEFEEALEALREERENED